MAVNVPTNSRLRNRRQSRVNTIQLQLGQIVTELLPYSDDHYIAVIKNDSDTIRVFIGNKEGDLVHDGHIIGPGDVFVADIPMELWGIAESSTIRVSRIMVTVH